MAPADQPLVPTTPPGAVDGLINLAALMRRIGRFREAEATYRQVLDLAGDHPEALWQLGLLRYRDGDTAEAAALLHRALPGRPDVAADLAAILYNHGNARYRAGGDPLPAYRAVLRIDPGHAGAWLNQGIGRRQQGDNAGATTCWRHALALAPHQPEVHLNLGAIPGLQPALRNATALSPDRAPFWLAFADSRRDDGDLIAAARLYRRTLILAPSLAAAALSLALIWRQAGRLAEAETCLRATIAVAPDADQPDLRHALAEVLLLHGAFPEGFALMEWRRQTPRFRALNQGRRGGDDDRDWDGAPVPARSVELVGEGGFGDMIQFVRYYPLVRERCRDATIIVPPSLVRLFSGLCRSGRSLAAAPGFGPFPAGADGDGPLQVPMASLPLRVDPALTCAAGLVPYLHPEPARVARWRQRLSGAPGLRVGIAWQPAPGDPSRAVPLAMFRPLAMPGVRLVSLQKGPAADQRTAVDFAVEDPGPEFDAGPDAFVDSAAVMMALDLVISIDTAVAHLAGALGRPVWIAIKRSPDWRWTAGRDDSPWYPSARLFRQRSAGDWSHPIAAMAAALAATTADHRYFGTIR